MAKIELSIIRDDATPAVNAMNQFLTSRQIKRAVGVACTAHVKRHLLGLGPNKMGFPSTGFYAGAAKGTTWDFTPEGVVIQVENESYPGAMNQRFHGGPIDAKDKLLTIPARAEFYGHRASEFDNLKVARFGKTLALVIAEGGTGTVNFKTGRSQRVKGAGQRSEGAVAYWLVSHVDQDADPGVLPDQAELASTAILAVDTLVKQQIKKTTFDND